LNQGKGRKMPKLSSEPAYREHRASGQAVVTIGGKDFYLGKYGSERSKIKYHRLIFEWLGAGRTIPEPDGLTVSTLCAEFWRFAKRHCIKHGSPTGTAENYKPAISLLRTYYGDTPAAGFSPRALKDLRQMMIDDMVQLQRFTGARPTEDHHAALRRRPKRGGLALLARVAQDRAPRTRAGYLHRPQGARRLAALPSPRVYRVLLPAEGIRTQAELAAEG